MSAANRSTSSGEKTPVSIASMASASLGNAAITELACKAARRRSSTSSARKPKMKMFCSGGGRFQGGTLSGITSKLDYLNGLGVTTLWVGPTFKQRTHFDSYHGYAIQDFLDIDPRFGNRQDMVQLVAEAHKRGIRILLDVVFNHTGNNWIYA